jgi:hypothetical protein
VKFFRNFAAWEFQFAADKIDRRIDVVQSARVGDDGFDRNIVSEDFIVRVENDSALGKDRLLDNVFFSRKSRVLIVLDHLEIDQAKRKRAEEKNEAEADNGAACSTVPFHLTTR